MGKETIWAKSPGSRPGELSGCIVRVTCFGKDFFIFSGQTKIKPQNV